MRLVILLVTAAMATQTVAALTGHSPVPLTIVLLVLCLVALIFVIINLVVDMLYSVIDPRIREA